MMPDWKVGDSCIHRGRFGTITMVLSNGWSMVDFLDGPEEVPLMALEEPDRDPVIPDDPFLPSPEDRELTETSLYRLALAADPGPPFYCRYDGCTEDQDTRQKRAAHERIVHGKALKVGESEEDWDPNGD